MCAFGHPSQAFHNPAATAAPALPGDGHPHGIQLRRAQRVALRSREWGVGWAARNWQINGNDDDADLKTCDALTWPSKSTLNSGPAISEFRKFVPSRFAFGPWDARARPRTRRGKAKAQVRDHCGNNMAPMEKVLDRIQGILTICPSQGLTSSRRKSTRERQRVHSKVLGHLFTVSSSRLGHGSLAGFARLSVATRHVS